MKQKDDNWFLQVHPVLIFLRFPGGDEWKTNILKNQPGVILFQKQADKRAGFRGKTHLPITLVHNIID
jgi:hypothetical protein